MYKHKIYSLEKTECRALDFLFHIWLLFCCLFGSWFLSCFSCWFHYRHFTTFTFTVVFIGGLINFLLKGFLSFSQFTLLNKNMSTIISLWKLPWQHWEHLLSFLLLPSVSEKRRKRSRKLNHHVSFKVVCIWWGILFETYRCQWSRSEPWCRTCQVVLWTKQCIDPYPFG